MRPLLFFIVLIFINCGSSRKLQYFNLLQENDLQPIKISDNYKFCKETKDLQFCFTAIDCNFDTVYGIITDGVQTTSKVITYYKP